MKLFLIRHGQSKGNIKPGFISGQTDPEGLTQKGRIQVTRTAYELRNEKIDQILVSPVVRAQETSRILHHYFQNATIQTAEWLSELHHGVFEGYYWWEVIHKIQPAWRKHREDYSTVYPGGGESMEMMFLRVSEGLQNFINKTGQDAKVMIISHQAPITAMRYFLKHGGPKKITTDKKREKFIQYLHNVKLPNGGFVKAVFNGKVLQTLDEVSKFRSVQQRKGNIEFYAKGILDADSVGGIQKETVSKHAVYYLQNGGDHLLKILHDESVKSVKRHVAVYRYLREQGRSVPKVVFHDSSHEFYKNDVLIQDYVEGVDQKQCLVEHPAQAKKLMSTVYDKLNAIHTVPKDEVKDFWIPPVAKQFRNWKPFMLSNINMTLHMGQGGAFDAKTETRIIKILSCLKDYIRKGNYLLVPIHGDMAPGNIIISHRKITCKLVRIIDFEWVRFGDRLWDLAYYWGWLERNNADVAIVWHDVLTKKLTKIEMKVLEWFRVLFHAWTVRDMFEYRDDVIRLARGEKSREILNKLI